MTPEQITALAREYAEEMCGKEHESPMYFGIAKSEMEEKLRWLLRRYCLVDKSKAKQFFQSRQNILANQDKYDRYIVDEASAEKRLMLCLFPNLAKEVEG